MGCRTPVWGTRTPCWRFLMADLCWSEVVAEGNGAGGARQSSWGWQGSRWAHPRGCSQAAVTRLGGCSGRGQGAELAPGCPTPRKGSGVPHLHSEPPSLPPPGQKSLGLQPGSQGVLVDVDTNPSRTGLRPRARNPGDTPTPAASRAQVPTLGCVWEVPQPWQWDGLHRDPNPGGPRPLDTSSPTPSLSALGGPLCPPSPVTRGAVGTDTELWGH